MARWSVQARAPAAQPLRVASRTRSSKGSPERCTRARRGRRPRTRPPSRAWRRRQRRLPAPHRPRDEPQLDLRKRLAPVDVGDNLTKRDYLPKASSRYVVRLYRRLNLDLAEGLDLLVRVTGLPQRLDYVPPQVRDVARHEARLPRRTGSDPRLPDGGGQDAALGAPECLRAAPMLDLHGRVPDIGEGNEAIRVGGLRVGVRKHPPLEGEVRSGAAA